MTNEPLVLIETHAHQGGGHRQRMVTALAEAQPGTVVIAPYGLAFGLTDLRGARHTVVGSAHGMAAWLMLAAAQRAREVSQSIQRVVSRAWPLPLRRLPHQITLLERCLTEAACLRTARRLAANPSAVVILTASEALHGAAGLLGGPHLRFVHEQDTTEDLPVRLLGRCAARGERRVVALYPTDSVRDQVAPSFPGLTGVVRPFAVDGQRLSDAEREAGRAAFAIPHDEPAVCLVGGWWPYKDVETVTAALALLTRPLHVLVTGYPLDESVLDQWGDLPMVHLHRERGPVSEYVLRLIFGAGDATLVARRPGVAKESGLVVDAVRFGIPLLVSDHDPALTGRLEGESWARTFATGDPSSLASALDRLTSDPPPIPDPQAAARLGVPTATDQAQFLTRTYSRLLEVLDAPADRRDRPRRPIPADRVGSALPAERG